MRTGNLIWCYKGKEYNQSLTLRMNGVCLFEANADDLVTSAAGGIIVRLNFGGNREYPHELKRLGSKVLMIPRFTDLSEDYHALAKTAGRVLDYVQLCKLWESLRYPIDELAELGPATSEEVLTCWLLNSRVVVHNFTNVSDYLEQVASCVVSVEPSDCDREKLFSYVVNGVVSTRLVTDAPGRNVLMFVEQNGQVLEWLCVRHDADSIHLILDENTMLQVGIIDSNA